VGAALGENITAMHADAFVEGLHRVLVLMLFSSWQCSNGSLFVVPDATNLSHAAEEHSRQGTLRWHPPKFSDPNFTKSAE
jgi:hypothetical protein